jgi:aryl-alcohol dehydrogenase-like predicted oxidoreductase
MQYRPIGPFPNVSALILGTWSFSDPTGTYTKQPEEIEDAIVKAAFDAGVNTFDTAEAYGAGQSEVALGRALQRSGKARSDYYIFSKINPEHIISPEKIEEALNRSLKNLNTPYIDLYQIHWANHDIDVKPALEALNKLKQEGKIRAIGVSNFGVNDVSNAVASGVEIVSDQLPYSLVNRAIEFGIVQKCVEHKVSILAYSPLAQGLLTGKYKKPEDCHEGLSRSRHFHHTRSSKCRHKEEGCEKDLFDALAGVQRIADAVGRPMSEVALAWVLRQPGVSAAIIGASRPEQIAHNVASLSLNLTSEQVNELTNLTAVVKDKIGSNPDMWAASTRYA